MIRHEHRALELRLPQLYIDLRLPADGSTVTWLWLEARPADQPHRMFLGHDGAVTHDKCHQFILWPHIEEKLTELLDWCRENDDHFTKLAEALWEGRGYSQEALAVQDDLEDRLCHAMYDWGIGSFP